MVILVRKIFFSWYIPKYPFLRHLFDFHFISFLFRNFCAFNRGKVKRKARNWKSHFIHLRIYRKKNSCRFDYHYCVKNVENWSKMKKKRWKWLKIHQSLKKKWLKTVENWVKLGQKCTKNSKSCLTDKRKGWKICEYLV